MLSMLTHIQARAIHHDHLRSMRRSSRGIQRSILCTVSCSCQGRGQISATHRHSAFAFVRAVSMRPPPLICCMNMCCEALSLSKIHDFPSLCTLATPCRVHACHYFGYRVACKLPDRGNVVNVSPHKELQRDALPHLQHHV